MDALPSFVGRKNENVFGKKYVFLFEMMSFLKTG